MSEYRPEDNVPDSSPPLDYARWSKADLIAEVGVLNAQVAKWVGVAADRRGTVDVTAAMIDRAARVLNAYRDSMELDEDLAESVLRVALEDQRA